MNLVTHIRQHLTESEATPYDQLVDLIEDDSHPLMPLLNFIANVYNGGLAETLLERDGLDPVFDGLAQLEGSQARVLYNSLRRLTPVVTSAIAEYRAAIDSARQGDGGEDEAHDIMSRLDQNSDVRWLENWIYNGDNSDPLFLSMLEFCKQQPLDESEKPDKTKSLVAAWNRLYDDWESGKAASPSADDLARVARKKGVRLSADTIQQMLDDGQSLEAIATTT